MRSLSLVNFVELKSGGSVLKHATTFGDCDNDGLNEFIVGNMDGDLYIYKDKRCFCTASELGSIAAVSVGDLLNIKKNILVVVTIEGWCHLFDVANEVIPSERSSQAEEGDLPPQFLAPNQSVISPFHSQRIPPNTKSLLLGDVNGDGLVEMILGLTDRVLRIYQWKCFQLEESEQQKSTSRGWLKKDEIRLERDIGGAFDGRLEGLTKLEFGDQITSISLHGGKNGVSMSILVAQPGGKIAQVSETLVDKDKGSKSPSGGGTDPNQKTQDFSGRPSTTLSSGSVFWSSKQSLHETPSTESLLENITIEYHMLEISSKPSFENLASEIVGNVMFFNSEGQKELAYAIATIEGTIVIAKKNEILWKLHVDEPILSLHEIDDLILACTYDGEVYAIYQNVPTRLYFESQVATFNVGKFATGGSGHGGGLKNRTCIAFITFHEKVYVYPLDCLLLHLKE